jgi:hypothetical protein
MAPFNFLKHFKSKRYSPEMLNTIDHVISFCDHVRERKIYVTGNDECDHRLVWAYAQSLNLLGCHLPVGRAANIPSFFDQWINTIGINQVVVINEVGANMISYLHNSLYDIKYYRKIFAEFTYYRYIKTLKEKKF